MTETWNVRPRTWRRHRREPVVLEGVTLAAPELLAPSAVLELTGCRPGPFVMVPAPPVVGPWGGDPLAYVFTEHTDEAGDRWTDSLPYDASYWDYMARMQEAMSALLDRALRDIADAGPRIYYRPPEPDVMIVHEGRPYTPATRAELERFAEHGIFPPNPRYPEETDHA